MRRSFLVFALAVSLVGCGEQVPSVAPTTTIPSGAPSSEPTPSGETTPSPSGSAEPSVSPSPAIEEVPPGVQFLEPTASFPGGFSGAIADLGGELLAFGVGARVPAVASRSGSTWATIKTTASPAFATPSGYSHVMFGGFVPGPRVVVDGRIVMLATAAFGDTSAKAPKRSTRTSVIWSSTDGRTWERFDPRTVLGGRSVSVVLEAVVVTGSGFLATGSVASTDVRKRSDVVVLRSADGRRWDLAARLTTTWSSTGTDIHELGADLALSGVEFACYRGSEQRGTLGAQLRVWRSPDGGSTWSSVDLSSAEPVLHAHVSPLAVDCPKAGDLQALTALGSEGRLLGGLDDRVIALSEDGATAASTVDLITWTKVALADALPVIAGSEPAKTPIARLLTGDADGWVLRVLDPLRSDDGTQEAIGHQIRWWRSTDAGATWIAGTPGKPVYTAGAFFSLRARADGSVDLLANPTSASGPSARSGVRHSVAGPIAEWRTCAAVAGADCGFAHQLVVEPGTTSLTGLDVIGARLDGVTLAGVDLDDASAYSATIDGDLHGASLRNTNFIRAQLSGDWRGVDLRNAQLSSAVLSAIDLTGAELAGASLYGVTFGAGTTCPDGKAAKATSGPAACRLSDNP